MKFEVLLLEAVVLNDGTLSPAEIFGGQHIEKKRDVRHTIFQNVVVQLQNTLQTETPREALIGYRGVYISVANHRFSLSEGGNDQLVGVLTALDGT